MSVFLQINVMRMRLVFSTAKLFVPLDIEVEVLLRHTRSNNMQSCLEILVQHRPHLHIIHRDSNNVLDYRGLGSYILHRLRCAGWSQLLL